MTQEQSTARAPSRATKLRSSAQRHNKLDIHLFSTSIASINTLTSEEQSSF